MTILEGYSRYFIDMYIMASDLNLDLVFVRCGVC